MIHKKELVDHLCGYFGTTVEELSKKNRERSVALPRQMIMTYLYNHTTFEDAASVFGLDHATAVHGKRVIGNLVDTDKIFAVKWNDFCTHANRFFDSINYKGVPIYFLKGVPTVDFSNKILGFASIDLAKAYIDGVYDGIEMKEVIV